MFFKKFNINEKIIKIELIRNLIFFIGISLLLIYFYKIIELDENDEFYKGLLFSSILLIFLSSLCFIFKKRQKFFIFLICFIYLFEFFLNFSDKLIYFNKLNKDKYYNYLLNSSKNLSIAFDPEIFLNETLLSSLQDNKELIFPLSSKSSTELILCYQNKKFYNYFSDRYGFNNPDYVWEKNELDYILLGDEYIEGDCQNSNISNYLRDGTNNISKNIINLGKGGNGLLLSYATLLEYFPKNKKTNNLIFFINSNDLNSFKFEESSKILKKYLKPNFSQNLKNNVISANSIYSKLLEYELDQFREVYEYNKNFTSIFKDILKLKSISIIINKPIKKKKLAKIHEVILKRFDFIFNQVKIISDRNNINFLVVILISKEELNGAINFEFRNQMINILKKNNINYYDFYTNSEKVLKLYKKYKGDHNYYNHQLNKFISDTIIILK